uniref:Uncharacterized protein n=1 Tax=Oryza nivara TaxID=4536 RepID=A0A1Y8Z4S9_ORYNI
MPRLLAY